MRIVIDLQGAQTESRFRGIGRYVLALSTAIARNRGEHDVIIVLNAFFPDSLQEVFQAFEGILPKENITLWHALGPVRECDISNHSRLRAAEAMREHFIASLRPDVILITSLLEGHIDDAAGTVKCFSQIPTLVVVYDFIPLLNWDTYLGKNEVYAQYYQRKIESLKRADHLLAISNSALLEAKSALGVGDESVTNILAACDQRFQAGPISAERRDEILAQWGISRPFILYSGGDEPRKNIRKFITACGLLPHSLREQHQVVVLGKIPDDRVRELQQFCESCGLSSESVIFTDYVSDENLIGLYNLCRVFVFPTLHEGFGLPALEAMACGAAVIASNTTSLPEVIGCHDALFDPTDEADIAGKIERVLSDEAFRSKLREHGLHQSKMFSWERSAQLTISALEKYQAKSLGEDKWKDFLENGESDYKRTIGSIASVLPVDITPLELANIAACIEKNEKEVRRVLSRSDLRDSLTWRVEGPFDSTYSLALVNREIARGLSQIGHDIVLHSTEGPGDFSPNPDFLAKNPDIAELHKKSLLITQSDASVTSRNLYPPRVADMQCRLNFLHNYAWEESGFPSEWVDDFNQHLDGITCQSDYVEKVLVDHGVKSCISVTSSGVDHWERVEIDPAYNIEAKRFRFLHVSSCFPRKGVDVLLKAYGDSFSASDDVTLIIKTHPNPHNEVHRLLAELRSERSNFPDVVIIEDDLSDSSLKSIYTQCHALVAPSRAEGFGLPLAEAMLSGLPVITTGWSGQLDFCSNETAWLVDYEFKPAQTHFGLYDSVWAEPSCDHLARTMREVYELPPSVRILKSRLGREILLRDFSWEKVAQRLVHFAQLVSKGTIEQPPKIGWVTSWNTRCGIATYSAHLIEGLPDPRGVKIFASKADQKISADAENVIRCWEPHEDEDLSRLKTEIGKESIDVLVIQFNYGFFNLETFNQFLVEQSKEGRSIVLVPHSTIDPAHFPHKQLRGMVEGMKVCSRVLVHSVSDLNRLKKIGVVENVTLFPHGILDYLPSRRPSSGHVFKIASFGFFLPQKGLLELIDAATLLHKRGVRFSLLMLNSEHLDPVSRALIDEALKKVKSSPANIEICTDYLSDSECLDRLSQMDLVVFPYRNTAESASGAVRCALASGASVAVTPIPMFDDVEPATYKLSGMEPEAIADSLSDLIRGISEKASYLKGRDESSSRWRESHRYSKVSRRLYNLLCALHKKRDGLWVLK